MIKFNIKHILLLLLVLFLIYITYENCNCSIERFNISTTNLEEGNQKLAQLNLTTDYQNLKQEHNDNYNHALSLYKDEAIIIKNFLNAWKRIQSHNKNKDRTFEKGFTKFTFYTRDDFINIFTGFKDPSKTTDNDSFTVGGQGEPKIVIIV